MSSPEDKERHRNRLKAKIRKDKRIIIKSLLAKELENPLYHQRIVKDKKGKEHDLGKLTHADLIKILQDLDNGPND